MKAITFLMIVASSILFATANAQIINAKKVLERKTNKVIEKKVEQAVDSIFDAGKAPANNKTTEPKPKEETPRNTTDPRKGNTEPTVQPSPDSAPSLQAYSKYDFVPGEKVIFFDDFSQDNIGDFPALWNTNGSGEVVTTNLFPGKWLKFSSRNSIWTDALLKLPENYTIEFDIIPIRGEQDRMAGYDVRLIQSINAKAIDHGTVPGKAGFLFSVEYFGRPGYRTYINGNEGQGLGLNGYKEEKDLYEKLDQKYHIAIWVQKARVRVYQNETKLFDLPKAFPLPSVHLDRLRFEQGAAMISNIRIAVGTPDMRNKLMTEGKIVSYGIYFDVNKDIVKPESYGSLKEIAAILNEHPGVKIKIVGHTDSDGADAANLDLSKRRAASVKTELVKDFGIDASRMETDGMGETKPVAANDNPSNKALNRRVEFIKL